VAATRAQTSHAGPPPAGLDTTVRRVATEAAERGLSTALDILPNSNSEQFVLPQPVTTTAAFKKCTVWRREPRRCCSCAGWRSLPTRVPSACVSAACAAAAWPERTRYRACAVCTARGCVRSTRVQLHLLRLAPGAPAGAACRRRHRAVKERVRGARGSAPGRWLSRCRVRPHLCEGACVRAPSGCATRGDRPRVPARVDPECRAVAWRKMPTPSLRAVASGGSSEATRPLGESLRGGDRPWQGPPTGPRRVASVASEEATGILGIQCFHTRVCYAPRCWQTVRGSQVSRSFAL